MITKSNLLDLSGRTTLVTGAGQGVGAEVARYFALQGARVIVNDYVEQRASDVASEIRAHGGVALSTGGDVSSADDMAGVVAVAAAAFGPVDVLVNNAGNAGADPSGLTDRPFWEKDPAEWDVFLRVNLYGVLQCCRAVIPGMIAAGRGGRIVTVTSEAGRQGIAGLEVYSAAKAGAAGLMRSLARSLGGYGITVNCVAIGATRTPATKRMTDDPRGAEEALSGYMIRRFGEPADVAAIITFLVSDAAGWITGQTYPVNGGSGIAL